MRVGANANAKNAAAAGVPSPCVSICRMNDDGFCRGCLRTIDEIARWSRMSDAERRGVLHAIELREAAGFKSGEKS